MLCATASLVDLRDEEQVGVLFRLLNRLPHVIEFFLHELVFPETTPHQGLKLSTCGQALGGRCCFASGWGFLAPPAYAPRGGGQVCRYTKGSDAKMIALLTGQAVVWAERLVPS